MNTAAELRGKSEIELNDLLIELRSQQFDIRIKMSSGQFADTSKFNEYRKDIARIKTVLNEMKRK